MAAQCSRNRDGIPPAVSFWNPCAAQPHRKMDLLSVSACDLLIKGQETRCPSGFDSVSRPAWSSGQILPVINPPAQRPQGGADAIACRP
jgi:hypothetical protein